jgi:hypothetical protein
VSRWEFDSSNYDFERSNSLFDPSKSGFKILNYGIYVEMGGLGEGI